MISRYSIDSDTHSDLDSLSSGCSLQLKSPTVARQDHQRPTITSRRQSRLLYAEKYGLNSPDWYASSTDGKDSGNSSCCDEEEDNKKDDQEDNLPITLQRRSYSLSTTTLCGRPRSLFNLSQPSTATLRPAAFVKPTNATSFGTPPSTVPSDMVNVQQLYELYHKKVYMEGFVFKRNQCNSDGSPCHDDCWTKLYMELSGPILSLWDSGKLTNNGAFATILPHYINISDATATLVNDDNNDHSVMVILNTAGRNQYLIRPEPPTLSSAQHWVTAIRLSCFECARLFEIYTRYLLLRPIYLNLWQQTVTKSAKRQRIEGYIQARFAGYTEWKKYWAVAYDQREEKRLFGKSKSVPCRGQLMFYESKKSKHPSVTLVNIVYAYTLYPQSPQLIDQATIFKVEGTALTTSDLKTGEQQMAQAPSGTLLMTSTTKEMMHWLVGIFKVFKLYGLPSSLLDDPLNPKSLNFGETAAIHDDDDSDGLFLESFDVMHLPFGQHETLLDSKMAFTNVLEQKLKSIDAPSPADGGASKTSRPPLYAIKPRANSAPLLADINYSPLVDHSVNTLTQSPTFMSSTTSTTHPQRISMLMPRPMVYASDDSDDDDNDNESDGEQSDDDSIFVDTTTPQLTAVRTEKELSTPSEPSTPSPSTSLHRTADSNKILPPMDDDYRHDDNTSGDMLGFAKSLLSRTFGMDLLSPTSSHGDGIKSPVTNTSLQQSPSPSPSSSISNIRSDKPSNNGSTFATKVSPIITNKEPSPSKRISTRPLSSDGEDSDDEEDIDGKTDDDDDDDEPIHASALNKMKITTSPSLSSRPLSTFMSRTITTTTSSTSTSAPSTPGSNRFSVIPSSYDTSSSNTSTTTNTTKLPQHAQIKRHSVLSPQPMKSTSTPTRQQPGLVHKIDSMQQQPEDHQPIWETGSLMETDPRINWHRSQPQQQQQQQQQQQAWETGSMAGSVAGPDPRIAMYRHTGSVYGNGANIYNGGGARSVYGGNSGGSIYGGGDGYNTGASVYGSQSGGSVYGGDYPRMMTPLVQMENKPSEPRTGLIGVISQLEDEKREKENARLPSPQQQQQQQMYQTQLLYQQQLLQQQQMMMNNPMMMNPMMMNPMMMNPMMMNPMMMNAMMMNPMMMQQQWPTMNNGGNFYQQPPLMEEDGEQDEDDTPLGRPNRQQASVRDDVPLSMKPRAQKQTVGGV